MNNSPRLSIIITTYNRKLKVIRALESAVSEVKGENIEIIVVDDASTDDTEASVQSFIASKSIRYIKHSNNKGVCVSKNEGVRNAKADIVTFLDSDDTFEKGALTYILKFVDANPNIDAFMGGCRRTDKMKFLGDPTIIGITPYLIALKAYFMGDYLYVVKKKIFEKTPFLPNLLAFETIQMLEALKSGSVFYYDPTIMVNCDYSSPDRLSATAFHRPDNMVEGYQIFIQKFGSDYRRINFNGYLFMVFKMFIFCNISKNPSIKKKLMVYTYIPTSLKVLFYPVFFIPRWFCIKLYQLGINFFV
jgi:glycosyltransferase involved in cell wall biosynthesis